MAFLDWNLATKTSFLCSRQKIGILKNGLPYSKKLVQTLQAPVAIHHDGFAMWDSEKHEYNSGDMGPKRDITGEILAAVEKQGLKTFASFHYYTNWIYFNPGRTISPFKTDVNDPKYTGLYGSIKEINSAWDSGPMTEEFQQAWYDNVIEVIDKYAPDQLWFEIGFSDEGNIGESYIQDALAHYFNTAENLNKEGSSNTKR